MDMEKKVAYMHVCMHKIMVYALIVHYKGLTSQFCINNIQVRSQQIKVH